MGERRWPWVVPAVLLLTAGVAAAWSTYLHWLPCRGSLLSGSVLRGYRYGPEFSEACLRQMDSGPHFLFPPVPFERTPWVSELGAVAVALAGTAWLVLVVGMRWSLRTKAVAALPGLISLTLAIISAVAIASTSPSAAASMSGWLLLALEIAAVFALVAIVVRQPEVTGRDWVRVLVLAWGTTAFGAVHLVGEYSFMVVFSDANWDDPPLTGSVTVATLFVTAVVTLTLTLRTPALSRSASKDPSHAA